MVDNVRQTIYNFDRIYKTGEYILNLLIVGGCRMYKIEVESAKKVIKATISGMLSLEDVKNYLEELGTSCSKINSSEYTLIIDAREQKAMSQDAIPYVEQIMKFYVDTPFKKRFSVMLESAIAMSQVNRVGKKGVELFDIVTSVEEAYAKI